MTFEELGVIPPLCQSVSELGFEYPMPIQEKVIPLLLGEKSDIIALAQTGTGKTAAFGLPLIQSIDLCRAYPQALILAPTRELCVQIEKDLRDYSRYLQGLQTVAIYGGAAIDPQMKALRNGVHIVVATPGRLLDVHRRGALDLSEVHQVVLDEADEMLNMGFSESLDAILAHIPGDRHLLLFSATMPTEIERITHTYMKDPKEVIIGKRNVVNSNIHHRYCMVPARSKYALLKRIVDYYPSIYAIVFCRTRKETGEVAQRLIQDGYNAEALHGDLSQAQRDYVMQKFRLRNLQLLIATDVAARGLDVDDLTHVIHFGLPDEPELYTHRSGRTARAGKSGISIAICHSREHRKIRDIEKATGIAFEKHPIPSGTDICEKKLFSFVDKLEHTVPSEVQIAPYLEAVTGRLSWLDREELLGRILHMELERLIKYYDEEAEEIEDVTEKKESKSKSTHKNTPSTSFDKNTPKGWIRLRVNLGKRDRIYPNTLIDIVNKCMDTFVEIGKIDIFNSYSYFDVPQSVADEVCEEMSQYDISGRRLCVDTANRHSSHKPPFRGEYPKAEKDKKRRTHREFTKGGPKSRRHSSKWQKQR